MCVLIYSPAGVEKPSKEIINAAHEANPHGCGIVSPSVFYKGLSFAALKKALKRVPKEEPCLIHFRLATHGSIKAANCHPFNRNGVFFAHNGILDIEPDGDRTDSETAFDRIIYPAVALYGIDSPAVDGAVDSIIGASKFALMQGGRVRLFGQFILGQDGNLYSNMRFRYYMRDFMHPTEYAYVR